MLEGAVSPVAGVPVAGVPVAGVLEGVPVAGALEGALPVPGVVGAGVLGAGVPGAGVPGAGVPGAGVAGAAAFSAAVTRVSCSFKTFSRLFSILMPLRCALRKVLTAAGRFSASTPARTSVVTSLNGLTRVLTKSLT